VVSVLKKSLEGADLPNLLFYGPPGTGKTSTILAIARDLFGDIYKQRVLELNASDERGISVVRDKVKRFSQLTASGKRPDGKPCPPYKIVILDEADSMTRDAQSALRYARKKYWLWLLKGVPPYNCRNFCPPSPGGGELYKHCFNIKYNFRRTMEKEGRTTKFCLICNYVSRIIQPLTSRCAKFRFKPLANDILVGRLKMIADKENVQVSSEAFQAILDTSEGDLRRAITTLQSAAKLRTEEGPEKGRKIFRTYAQGSYPRAYLFDFAPPHYAHILPYILTTSDLIF
jgi:replication factor C subunit 2/4